VPALSARIVDMSPAGVAFEGIYVYRGDKFQIELLGWALAVV
jgi:hypothetical protein